MANFIQLLSGVTLVLTFISLVNTNSLPDITPDTSASTAGVSVEKKYSKCSTDADCSGHGLCPNSTSCVCDRGWATHDNAADTDIYCNYKQRSKQTAFFLSFFVGIFGADWFYLSRANLGYIIAGILKLLLGCGCCGSWPLTYFGPELQNSESVKRKLRGVSTLFSLVAFVWWIVDWARVLGNKFPDGKGAGLMPW